MIHDTEEFIERRIITGMIVSTPYLRAIHPVWNPKYLESQLTSTIAKWCMAHFVRYNAAPSKDIEAIYARKAPRLNKELVADIEQVLSDLSEQYKRKKFNVDYLLDQTFEYFQQQHIKQHVAEIKDKLETGEITEAEGVAVSYAPVIKDTNVVVDPFDNLERVRAAFEEKKEALITFPRALGRLWNDQMIRDAFVSFMGPEKRGKTFWLIEMAMRGIMADCNVAFFQAGDMTEAQMIRRIGIYLTKRSDKAKYCSPLYYPTLDCVNNQLDYCTRSTRESRHGVFPKGTDLSDVNYDTLIDLHMKNPKYRTCHNCVNNKGAVWVKSREAVSPLTAKDVIKEMLKFRRRFKNRLRIATYPNETLTMTEVNAQLDNWERQDNFVPDIVIADYLDIFAPDPDCLRLDYRQQQNKLWQRARKLSQKRHCLFITATQTDADSYTKELLGMKNFTETKTKYAHVTAMYGLNQNDEEKKMGVMRINEIVVREGDFDRTRTVKVLQCLQMGRPYLGSYD